MNPAIVLATAQQIAASLPSIIAAYKSLRSQIQDGSLPSVEELLAKADAAADATISAADAEINKYKQS